MIDTYRLSDFLYSGMLIDALVVHTSIILLRSHTVTITINSKIVPSDEYLVNVSEDTKEVTITFKAQRTGSLCIFRHSNAVNIAELGTQKSGEQNEKFFDKLVQFAQDLDYDRASRKGLFDVGVDAGDVKSNPFDESILDFLNTEGKKTKLYDRAYKVAEDFKFGVNRYGGVIPSNLDDRGSFGTRARFTMDIGVDAVLEQDLETGISKFGNGYTLIKTINVDVDSNITSIVLYRRLMDNREGKYNVQKAMLGTRSTEGRIIHGNKSYVCNVLHQYDFITLAVQSKVEENNFNILFSGVATIFIDLLGQSVPIYIENDGISMKNYT